MKLTRRGLLAATILAPIVPWPKIQPVGEDFSWIDRFASETAGGFTLVQETDFVRLPGADHWWRLVNEGGGWQMRPWEPDRSRPASYWVEVE